MRNFALAVCLAVGLTGCGLLGGDPVTDPDTGETVGSVGTEFLKDIADTASDLAPVILDDALDGDSELSTETLTAIGGGILLALLGAVQTYRKRKVIMAKIAARKAARGLE